MHAIIIANGNFLVREIIAEAAQGKSIIALDGAANRLEKLQLHPQIIIGDFDSLDIAAKKYWGIQQVYPELPEIDPLPYQGNHGVLIVPRKDQNKTDLTKALDYCEQLHATSITIICATSSRLDHHEYTMRMLRTYYRPDRLIILHTEQQSVRFARNEQVTMQGKIGDKCGILAFPQGAFSSSGLEYDVENFALEFGISESACNALAKEQALVNITGDALLVMPPLLRSQREFMQKTEAERLHLLLRDL